MDKLGKIKRIKPRDIWTNEAQDFTPWLQKNIRLLADKIGIELDITESEGEVGSFRVDLVGKVLGTGRPVIIENQLGSTDHDHLGKLLTYAAGRDARVIIWIATNFHDKHIQALKWLNDISGEDQGFFGVQLEVIKVDDSRPAPIFDIVVQPSEWVKQQRQISRQRTPKQIAYQSFFNALISQVKQQHPGITSATKGLPQNWYEFPTGRSGFLYVVYFAKDSRFRVELYITTGDRELNKRAFEHFQREKENIEEEICSKLEWEKLEERRASRIALYERGSIEDPPERLKELQDWAVEKIGLFNQVFRERIRRFE